MGVLNFKKDTTLENNRVLLRPLLEEDLKHLLPFSINEPELWTYSLLPADGKENLEKYIAFALQKRKEEDSYPFIVFDKITQEYAGSTRFYDYRPNHKTVQLGYTWYGKKFQRTGLNKNCKYLLLSYAFDVLGLERVEFRADATNQRSITAMKSIGCNVEGILRNNCTSPTGRRDSIVLSILKPEWQSRVKSLLSKAI
ncbi:GNAT family N-acetyltransferase [Patiriisocius hiemis]|uniref:GNAT family protein n=1 Tax=Patiriisocius hiemis TaxID=3075604 RepID=A0ABU2YE84_9FLAO|nr:GNAT family protein [Constantimarinum sp. W242]MDT0556488.1 GNAT family protein [Constantimarinum sp. W242]